MLVAALVALLAARVIDVPPPKPEPVEAAATPTWYRGKVVDALTASPIEGAFVTLGNNLVRTDQEGKFEIQGGGDTLGIRAYGHWREAVAANTLTDESRIIVLKSFTPKALYLSFFGVGDKKLRASAMSLIKDTELNSLVIDVKGDRGMVAFKSSSSLAAEIGAQKIITIRDINSLVSDLHAKGIYAIARIVVFKDDRLARSKPELAIKTADGAIWNDREGLAWSDPFNGSVWNYNIDLAVEAARAGFDEIQFDYVRLPDAPGGLAYTKPDTEANRVMAVSGFLSEARTRLTPYNVFLAADIFGYVPWNPDDTHIGQKIENLAASLDYISLMLYPSGFQFGIPGYTNPVQHPREVVYLSLEKARHRTGLPSIRFRPWLQAFQDYAFDKIPFQGEQIRMQIDAAEHFGSDGWMLWNPRNVYTMEGLKPELNDALQDTPLSKSPQADSAHQPSHQPFLDDPAVGRVH